MAAAPPSQFAALLRQSKFASFDPAISQVYATYGGHTHRGNWGLKRPLPLRRRNASITVRAVDSPEQQTEWKSAEQQNRWIRMWDEVGTTPTIAPEGMWKQKLGPMGDIHWLEDSELVRDEEKALDEVGDRRVMAKKSMAIPNTRAMSEKEFEAYLEKLRKMRPAFRQFVQEKAQEEGRPASSLWEHANNPGDLSSEFIATHAREGYDSVDSRIEQRPQRFGGLSYTKASALQTYLMNKPQPGRILQAQGQSRTSDFLAGFAGMTPTIPKNAKGLTEVMAWDELARSGSLHGSQRGVTKFRFMSAQLNVPPRTVGENAGGTESVSIYAEVRSDTGTDHSRSNPHLPGSREYVGAEMEEKKTMVMTRKQPTTLTKFNPSFRPSTGSSVSLLNTMNSIIHTPLT